MALTSSRCNRERKQVLYLSAVVLHIGGILPHLGFAPRVMFHLMQEDVIQGPFVELSGYAVQVAFPVTAKTGMSEKQKLCRWLSGCGRILLPPILGVP